MINHSQTKGLTRIMLMGLMFILHQTMYVKAQGKLTDKIKFIDTYYENASPIIWDALGDTAILINFLYDYERGNVNRQSTHINLRIEAEKGTELNLIFSGFVNIYNGAKKTSYGRSTDRNISCFFSEDYKNWKGVETTRVANSDFDIQVKYTMKSNSVYIAKIPVYSVSELEGFKNRVSKNKLVKIIPIGETVEKRELEIIRVGKPSARHTVVIRARAHAWEPGGNWVVEGLVDGFIEASKKSDTWVNEFCYYIMPMANKDGVFRGMSRFNVNGSDLNRGWGYLADSVLTPENYLLEQFIKKLIKNGKKPDFTMDLHNDNYGNIHVAKPKGGDLNYDRKMGEFYELMKERTWFSGSQQKVYTDDPQRLYISAGLYQRFDIVGCVLELNADWIDKLNKIPSTTDWKNLGNDLNEVFSNFFQ